MAYDQNIQRICANPSYTHTGDKSLWREAPDIVNKSSTVIVSQTYPSNNIRLSLKKSYMFS